MVNNFRDCSPIASESVTTPVQSGLFLLKGVNMSESNEPDDTEQQTEREKGKDAAKELLKHATRLPKDEPPNPNREKKQSPDPWVQ